MKVLQLDVDGTVIHHLLRGSDEVPTGMASLGGDRNSAGWPVLHAAYDPRVTADLEDLAAGNAVRVIWGTSWLEDLPALRDLARHLGLSTVEFPSDLKRGPGSAAIPPDRESALQHWKIVSALDRASNGDQIVVVDDGLHVHGRSALSSVPNIGWLVPGPTGLTTADTRRLRAWALGDANLPRVVRSRY